MKTKHNHRYITITLLLVTLIKYAGCQGEDEVPEPKCEGAIPAYLTWPHTYLYHLETSADLEVLKGERFPRYDSLNFEEKWAAEDEGELGIKFVIRTTTDGGAVVPSRENAFGWRHKPQPLSNITESVKMKSMEDGIAYTAKIKAKNNLLVSRNITLDKGSPSDIHQQYLTVTHDEAVVLGQAGMAMSKASSSMAASMDSATVVDLQLIEETRICEKFGVTPQDITCVVRYPYRSFDGSCNNLRKPRWGQSFTAFRRVFLPDYADGISKPRRAKDGSKLPNARRVSVELKSFPRAISPCFSVFQMSFGQFLDHDLTLTPTAKGLNGSTIPCCNERVQQDPSLLHEECFPIAVDLHDPFYQVYGKTCLNFVRSLPASRCRFGPREQMNQLSAYIDGSAVYGSSEKESDSLRTFRAGQLSTFITKSGHELLPVDKDGVGEGCNTQEEVNKGHFCFRSGDARVNEHILLTLITTLFAREHNRIAKELSKLNPSWNDEKVFQETRHIVAAEIQHITYNEFLSGLLGPILVEALDLKPQKAGVFSTDYDDGISATIANEFSTAALRMGHSMIPEHFYEKNDAGKYSSTPLNSVIFNPFHMYSGSGMSDMIQGALSQPIGQVDQAFSSQITGHLFQSLSAHGLDLVALNIQRGRDHGLPGYTTARRECGFPPINSFSDLDAIFDPKDVAMFRRLYKKVDDIDLFVGGMAEKALPGGLVGPTFACILGDQFVRLKKGDRFWYENSGEAGSFTPDQLRSLHQVSFSRILCDNFPEIQKIQRWPLQLSGAMNPRVSCSSLCLPSLDLTAWKH